MKAQKKKQKIQELRQRKLRKAQKQKKKCVIKLKDNTDEKTENTTENKPAEIIVEAEIIENYETIKNSIEFKEELEQMKESYGIYNESETEVDIENVVIKVERLKGIGIYNKSEGTITLGINDDEVNTASPIIYAIADNTIAIKIESSTESDSGENKIVLLDGRLITKESVKDMLTTLLEDYVIKEFVETNTVNTTLQEVEQKVDNY